MSEKNVVAVPGGVPQSGSGLHRLVFWGLLATIALAVLDQNIVTTSAWAMVRDLDPAGGLEKLPWLLTAFMLAATVTQPLYGKLVDSYGAKPVYLAAVGTFLAGSALCGLAQSIGELIAFRAVQGLGAGGLMSVTMVIIAIGSPSRRRAGRLGMGGIILGLGVVAGPLMGGFLTDQLSWRWVFYVNLPLGVFAWVAVATLLHLPKRHIRHRIDFPGAALIAAAAGALLLVTEWGGKDYAWTSATILGLAGAGVVLVVAFAWRQLTVDEPIFPVELFRDAAFRVVSPLSFVVGFALVGSIVYIATYLQIARGMSPTSAGLHLLPMAAGMTIAGTIAGKLVPKLSRYKFSLISGTAFAALGLAMLSLLHADTLSWLLNLDLFVLGCGFGQIIGMTVFAVQNSVPAKHLGAATTGIRFTQTLGGAFGSIILGSILTRRFAANLPAAAHAGGDQLSASQLHALPPEVQHAVIAAFVGATDTVFLTASGIMLAALALALLLRETPLGESNDIPTVGDNAVPAKE